MVRLVARMRAVQSPVQSEQPRDDVDLHLHVALGLVIGTAVSFSGVVLALGAIITPTKFVPRE